MADYITKIKTKDGDKQIDYNSLANKPQSDTTLSQNGKFADAKAVGDSLAKKLDSPTSAGTTGQVLTKTPTGQQWQTPAASTENVEQIETNKGNITTLQGKVNTLESEMDTAQADITELESNVGTLTSKMSTAESDIDNLQSAQSTMNTTLQGKLDATGVDNKIKGVAPFVDASFDTSEEDTNKLVLSKYGGRTKEVLIPKDKYIQSAFLGENNVLTLTFTDNSTVTVDLSDLITPIDDTLTQEGQAADAKAVGEKIKESAISDEYSGASEYICQPTANAPVVLKEISGKTEQGADPSPDNPQVIKGVGGMGHFDGAWRQGLYKAVDGAWQNSENGICSQNPIKAKAGDSVTLKYLDKVDLFILAYKSDGTYLGNNVAQNANEVSYTLPIDTAYVHIDVQIDKGASITPSDAKYCTVTVNGKYQTGVETTGAQLFDVESYPFIEGYWIDYNLGYISSNENYKCTDFIPFSGHDGLTINLNHIPSGSNQGMAFYSSNAQENYISGGKGNAIIVPEGTQYMRFTVDASVADNDVMLNAGSSALPWEPYHHTAISIPLTSPLYEGDKLCYVKPGESYVDAEGDTVVADRILYGCYRENAVVVFDGSEDETWEIYASEQYSGFRIEIEDMKENSYNDGFSNLFPVQKSSINDPGIWLGSTSASSLSNYMYVHNVNPTYATDVNSWKTWLQSHNMTVVYPISTPYFEPFTDQSIFYGLRTDDTLSYVYSTDPIEPNVTVDVAKNETGGILLESYTALAQLIGETVIIE